MYYRINEFIEDWNNEIDRTSLIFEMIPEGSKSIVVCDTVRSLDRLAFHIPQGIVQISTLAGLLDVQELAEDPLPPTMAGITGLYRYYHARVTAAIPELWTDEMLTGSVTMYGQEFRRGEILSLLVNHEMHHRSQLTVVMRLAGLRVPGLYGPVSEDWQVSGLPVPK
jgi:uncharacterized damage-inducible protein DinB